MWAAVGKWMNPGDRGLHASRNSQAPEHRKLVKSPGTAFLGMSTMQCGTDLTDRCVVLRRRPPPVTASARPTESAPARPARPRLPAGCPPSRPTSCLWPIPGPTAALPAALCTPTPSPPLTVFPRPPPGPPFLQPPPGPTLHTRGAPRSVWLRLRHGDGELVATAFLVDPAHGGRDGTGDQPLIGAFADAHGPTACTGRRERPPVTRGQLGLVHGGTREVLGELGLHLGQLRNGDTGRHAHPKLLQALGKHGGPQTISESHPAQAQHG